MDYYIYAADVYCTFCAQGIMDSIHEEGHAPAYPDDETTFDSDEYPKGPFSDESDTPHNCANCGDYMEGPLTVDGVEYVIEAMNDDIQHLHTNSTVRDWAAHLDNYNLTPKQQAIYDEYAEMFNNA